MKTWICVDIDDETDIYTEAEHVIELVVTWTFCREVNITPKDFACLCIDVLAFTNLCLKP